MMRGHRQGGGCRMVWKQGGKSGLESLLRRVDLRGPVSDLKHPTLRTDVDHRRVPDRCLAAPALVDVAAHDQRRALALDHLEDGPAAAVTAVNLIHVALRR